MNSKNNPHIGSSLESWLKEEGIFEEADAIARERVDKWLADKDRQRRTDPERKFHRACFDCEWWHGKDQPHGECYLPKVPGGEVWNEIKIRITPADAVMVTNRDFFCANWESDSDLSTWDHIVKDGRDAV